MIGWIVAAFLFGGICGYTLACVGMAILESRYE